MRGKTNVGSAGGHIINGIKKDCIVRGSEILKGDFVTVYNELDPGQYLDSGTATTNNIQCVKKINEDIVVIARNEIIYAYNIKTNNQIAYEGLRHETGNSIVSYVYSVGRNLFLYVEGAIEPYSEDKGTGYSFKVRGRLVKFDESRLRFEFLEPSDYFTALGDGSIARIYSLNIEKRELYCNFQNGRIAISVVWSARLNV